MDEEEEDEEEDADLSQLKVGLPIQVGSLHVAHGLGFTENTQWSSQTSKSVWACTCKLAYVRN